MGRFLKCSDQSVGGSAVPCIELIIVCVEANENATRQRIEKNCG
jgi:hypothetical protein